MKNPKDTITALLFDLDGTLVDSLHCMHRIVNELLAEYNRPPVEKAVLRGYVDNGSHTIIERSFSLRNDDPLIDRLQSTLLERYIQRMALQTPLFEPLPETLRRLNQSSLPWGIVTSRPMSLTTPLIETHPFLQQHHCLVCSDTLNICKPDPRPLLHACEQLKLAPSTVAYIGDTENDMLAAHSAGMKTAFVHYGYLRHESKRKALQFDRSFHCPKELSQWVTDIMLRPAVESRF